MDTEATIQDVETTEASTPNNDDLFGDSPESTEAASPESHPGEETPSGDEAEVEEGEAEATSEEAEQAEESEEEVEPELPASQAKTYPDDLMAAYAKRFGFSLDELKGDKRALMMVKSKIDSDIFINQTNAKLEALAETETEEEDEAPPETEAAATEKQAEYEKFISGLSSQVISPQHVEKYGHALALAMLGTDPAKIEDPDQRAEAEAFVARGSSMAKAILPGFVDLIETLMPQRMEAYLESAIPGFRREREIQEASSAWEGLRKNPEFAHFPAYGARESDYGKFIQENAAKIPNFQGMVFTGPNGAPLPRAQQVAAKLQLIAQVASGKRATPQVVKEAAATAKKQVEEQNNRKQAAKSLGAGNSKTQLTAKKSGNDDIFGEAGEFSSKRIGS